MCHYTAKSFIDVQEYIFTLFDMKDPLAGVNGNMVEHITIPAYMSSRRICKALRVIAREPAKGNRRGSMETTCKLTHKREQALSNAEVYSGTSIMWCHLKCPE